MDDATGTTPYLPFEEALAMACAGATPTEAWLVPLLTSNEEEAERLYHAADAVRAEHLGNDVHLRGLIEFSNFCRKNCNYCGLRRANRQVERYRLTPEAIIRTAREAQALGYRTVVLQSGEDAWYTAERMAEIIRGIKAVTELAITLAPANATRRPIAAGAKRARTATCCASKPLIPACSPRCTRMMTWKGARRACMPCASWDINWAPA